jgi:hypothetical protein
LPTLKEFAELTPESRDIYERRIGEPLPGQGQGMDLQTHYEAPERADEADEPDDTDGAAQADEVEAAAEDGEDAELAAAVEAAPDEQPAEPDTETALRDER